MDSSEQSWMPFNALFRSLGGFFPLLILHLGLFVGGNIMISIFQSKDGRIPELLRLSICLFIEWPNQGWRVSCIRCIKKNFLVASLFFD